MNPIPCLLDNIKNNWFLLTIVYNFVNNFDNVIDIVPSQPSYRLDLISQRGSWIFLSEFKHDIDLVLKLIAFVWFAQNIEFVGGCLFDNLELVEIDVG